MTITEVRQALGSWEIRLRDNTPRSVLDRLDYFGHIAVIPNRVNPAEYGDALLAAARYVGVFRNRSASDQFLLRGSGMAFWLGDEDNKGDIFESPVTLTAQTFAASVAALLPPGGAVTAGTIFPIAGAYTNVHHYQTSRQALDYLTQVFQGEWRVSNTGTLDAGLVSDLYVTTPRAIIMRKSSGRDLRQIALPGRMELGTDAEEFTTRVVVLAEGEGSQIALGDADIVSNPFNDIHGNDAKFTRLISESDTTAANADLRAQLWLNQFSLERQTIQLSTSTYDIKGNVSVGDYVNVYDPDSGLFDPNREVNWEGQPINPAAIRVIEMTYPVPEGWTVAFRTNAGEWIDLSQYYAGEEGDTTLVVGDLSRSLATGEPVGVRPNLTPPAAPDTTIPNNPAFLSFNVGSYQSDISNTTKSAIRITWTTPLNTDASTITDGDHYEIRYRVSAVLGYRVKWGQIGAPSSNPYKWGELLGNPWGAPISDPVADDPEWIVAYASWGTNEMTITELTPGVTYEMQIRATDLSGHLGPYSASSMVTTTGDLFAPSTPAAPTVAASRIAIQVTHNLGKASGGTFNLEQDLDHLEIHVGGSNSFYPDASTLKGKLTANASMLSAQIPAVGTFQIEQTDQVHVKIRAVDRSGNKSSASVSATATAELIDNAHISDLSVSKITAGSITSTWIMAGSIRTANSGQRVQIDNTGIRGFTSDGVESIQMDTAGTFRAKNASAVTQIEMGLLTDGTYGLAAVNGSGVLVPLSRLAFGLKADFISTTQITTSTSYTDLGTVGPTVTDVEVGSLGKMLVILGCRAFVGGSGTVYDYGVSMSFQIIEQAGSTEVLAASDTNGCRLEALNAGTNYTQECNVMRAIVITGLSPGLYTVRAKYRDLWGGREANFGGRFIVVLPY